MGFLLLSFSWVGTLSENAQSSPFCSFSLQEEDNVLGERGFLFFYAIYYVSFL